MTAALPEWEIQSFTNGPLKESFNLSVTISQKSYTLFLSLINRILKLFELILYVCFKLNPRDPIHN